MRSDIACGIVGFVITGQERPREAACSAGEEHIGADDQGPVERFTQVLGQRRASTEDDDCPHHAQRSYDEPEGATSVQSQDLPYKKVVELLRPAGLVAVPKEFNTQEHGAPGSGN